MSSFKNTHQVRSPTGIAISLMLFCMWCTTAYGQDPLTLKIASGFEGGAYDKFASDLTAALEVGENSKLRLEKVATAGTVDSLEKLENKTVDLAIIQNDIGHYTYSGKYGYRTFTGFSAVLPLFPEFVHVIVRNDSDIRVLGDLAQKTVSMGPKNSGVHRNALDLVREIGLRPNVDFQAIFINPVEAVRRIRDGEIDGMFHTGATLPIPAPLIANEFRSLTFSDGLVSSLTIAQPYYSLSERPSNFSIASTNNQTLSVTAYLVIGDHVSRADAAAAIEVIADTWPQLSLLWNEFTLIPLGDSLLKRPFPYHKAATALFLERSFIEDSNTDLYVFILAPILILLVWWANTRCRDYDRLGNMRAGSGDWLDKTTFVISRAGIFVYIGLGFMLIVTFLAYLIRVFESQHAAAMNIDNAFANIGFDEALLWMVMFMGSGQTGDIFPLSTAGRILVAIIPAIGFSTILGSFFVFSERQRKARAARMRGTLTKQMVDHVLICGWNEKVPGIVYALTSSDAPEKKKVVVIAEMDGETPLEEYQFDSRYVSYCRGNSINHNTLKKASVGEAESAIVVAGYRKRENQNLESVLTVMAVKETYGQLASTPGKGIYVAAEMVHNTNKSKFEICNVDSIVHGTTVVDRLLAQCCCSEYMLDFVMDVLTYDSFDEMHTQNVSELCDVPLKTMLLESDLVDGLRGISKIGSAKLRGRFKPDCLIGITIDEAKQLLADYGINVVGAIRADKQYHAIIDHKFDAQSPYKIWIIEPEYLICEGDTLVYFGGDKHDLFIAIASIPDAKRPTASDRGALPLNRPAKKKVAIVGNGERAQKIFGMLSTAAAFVDPSMHCPIEYAHCIDAGDQDESELDDQDNDFDPSMVDVVVIVNEMAGTAAATSEGDLRAIDAETLFTARRIRRDLLSAKGSGDKVPKIVAEMLGRDSRQLFQDAGVKSAIPRSLLVERMLAKLAYSKGDVSNLLLALLAYDDGIHLHAIKIDSESHPELIGRTFSELMFGLPKTVQLMAWLPNEARKALKNEKEDFSWHFISSPNSKEDLARKVAAGDTLILIVNSSELEASAA